MRLIDADELWEKMYRYSDNEGAKMPYDNDDSLILKDSACFLIENAPTIEPEQRWISCSELLPNSQAEVNVSCRDDSADTIYRYTASGWITTNGEYWIVDNEINPYVVAWMPLPKPWEGGEG